jgi:hypothetical protein
MGNNNEMDVDLVNSNGRIRQYPVGSNGPFIVIIRRKEVPLESKKITKYVFSRFKHVQKISQENEHKIKIVFGEESRENENSVASSLGDDNKNDNAMKELYVNENEKYMLKPSTSKGVSMKSAREEANELPKYEEWNKKYFVYIPEKLVETKAVISWAVSNDVKEIMEENSTGKFGNPAMRDVKVLEAVRLKKKSDDPANTQMQDTATVIITFEGLVMPKWLNFDRMLIPVREFKPRQMYCDNCHKYNHTKARCGNKKVEPPPEIKCLQCKSADHEGGSKECPKRKILEKKVLQTTRQLRKKTYAEMLQELDPQGVMPNGNSENSTFPPLIFPSRSVMAAKRKAEQAKNDSQPRESPQRKKRSTGETNSIQEPPPGLRVQIEEKNQLSETIVEFLRKILVEKNFPPFVMQFFDNTITPFLHKNISELTNSIMEKFNFMSWMCNPTA